MSNYNRLGADDSINHYNITIYDQNNNKITDNRYNNELSNVVKYLEDQQILTSDPNKIRKLSVTRLGDQQYRLKIGDNQFYVATYGKENTESQNVTIIREKIVQNKFFKFFRNVFSTIKHLFFDKEKFPPPGQRLPSEIIKQDYRLLKKSLEAGKSLFSVDRSGMIFNRLVETITTTTDIDKALRSKDPGKEINKLAEEWFTRSKTMPNNEEFTFVTGYVNDAEVMQPIMVRVYKKDDKLFLETYCDSPDVGKKVAPLQVREINLQSGNEDENFFKPFLDLLLPQDPQKGLPAFGVEDTTLKEIFEEKQQKELQKLGLELPKAPPEQTRTPNMTFERLMQSLDNKKNNNGNPLLTVQPNVDDTSTSASKTQPQRLVKWFDSLLEGENKLNAFEKSSLLFVMTEISVKKQIDQITKKTPPTDQLRMYRDCLIQIKHASTKIAPAIIGDPNANILIPPKLQKLQRQCELKIAELNQSIRTKSLERNLAALSEGSGEAIPLSLPPLQVRAATTSTTAQISSIDVSALQNQWTVDFNNLQNSIIGYEDQATQRAIAKQNIQTTLENTIQRLQKQGSPKHAEAVKLLNELDSLLQDGKIEEISTRILDLVDGPKLEEFFLKMRRKHFANTAFQSAHSGLDLYAENFKQTATRLVISPMLLPTISPDEFNGLVQMIDPQTVFADEYLPVIELFRASNHLSHFVTPEQRKEYTKVQMERDYEVHLDKAIHGDLIDRLSALDTAFFLSGTPIKTEISELLRDFRANRANFTTANKKRFLEKAKDIGITLNQKFPPLKIEPQKLKNPYYHDEIKNQLTFITDSLSFQTHESIKNQINTFIDKLQANKGTTDPQIVEELIQDATAIQTELNKMPKDPTSEMRDLQSFYYLSELHAPSFETLQNIENIEEDIDIPPLEDNNTSYTTSMIGSLSSLASGTVEMFKAATNAQDKTIMKQSYDSAIKLLKTIPPMGTERVNGVYSPWSKLSPAERQEALKALDSLEKVIWEYHMRLGSKNTPTDISLLQIKTQTIRLGLLRAEVSDVKKSIQDFLQRTAHSTDPSIATKAKETLEHIGVINTGDPVPPEIQIDFSKLTMAHVSVLAAEINTIEPGTNIPAELLIVDKYTLPLYEYNFNLTQDLTNLSSYSENTHRDLAATFHYLVQDLHYGVGDHVWKLRTSDTNYLEHRNFTLFPLMTKRDKQESLFEKVNAGNIPANSEAYKWSESLMKGFLYYKSIYDPEYTLKDTSEDKSFYETHPDSIFREGEVTLNLNRIPAIVNSNGVALAEIHHHGNGVNAERKLHLPVMMHYDNVLAPHLVDRRTHATYDAWMEYSEQSSLKAPMSLSPDILASLLSIRQVPGDVDRSFGTPYASSTLPNALDFVCHMENLHSLKNDFVQKFLLESIFGPFICQEGLLEHLPHISNIMQKVEDNISYCMENGMIAEAAFLTTVLSKLHDEVDFALKDIENRGIAGNSYTMLPCWKGRLQLSHGLKPLMDRRSDDLQRIELHEEGMDKMDAESYSHPIVEHTLQLQQLKQRLSDAKTGIGTTLIEMFKEFYFETDPGHVKWKIDRFPLSMQVSIYMNLAEQYGSYFSQKDSLDDGLNDLQNSKFPSDISIMLTAWKTLGNPKNPAFNTVRNQAALSTLQNTLKKHLETHINEPEIQAEITKAFLRLSPHITAQELSTQNTWSYSPPGLISITDNLNRVLTLDITQTPTAYIKGENVEAPEEITRKFPAHLLQRAEIQQALGNVSNTVTCKVEGKETTYKWSYDDQEFEIRELDTGNPNSPLEIKRIIDDKTYVFQSLSTLISKGNVAERLLHDHGVWRIPGTAHGYVYPEGMSKPSNENAYFLEMNSDNSAGRLMTADSKYAIGTSSLPENATILPFAGSGNIIAGYGKDGIQELRLVAVPLSFEKSAQNTWECKLNGKNIGKLGASNASTDQFCNINFGAHWDQFIVPLTDNNETNKYILIPYMQHYDVKTGVQADQNNLSSIPQPEIIAVNKDGTLDCSTSAALYIANQLLFEANTTKDPEVSRNKCLQAEQLIQKITQQNLPATKEEQDQLHKMLLQLEQQIPISLPKMPSNAILSLTLKLRLQMHRLQDAFEKSTELKLSPEQRFANLETTFKLVEAYQHLKSPDKKEIPAQMLRSGFDLTPNDKAKLLEIVSIFMKDLVATQPSESYFTGTYSNKGEVSIGITSEISPEFVLALIRSVKKPEDLSPLTLTQRTNPLLINELVENFWSYFFTIKNNNLSPDNLLILMQPSVLPLDLSQDEKSRLEKIDLQARQFLLTYAKLKTTVLAKDPKTTLEESLKNSKEDYKKVINGDETKELLEKLKSNGHPLSALIDRVSQELDQLKVETKTIKVSNQDIEIVDLVPLTKQLSSVQTALYNVKSEIYNTKERAKVVLADVNKEVSDLENEKSTVIKLLRETDTAISNLENSKEALALAKAKADLEQKLKENVDNPNISDKENEQNNLTKQLKDVETALSNIKDEVLSLDKAKKDYELKLNEIKLNIDKMMAESVVDPIINKSMSKKTFLQRTAEYEKNIQTLENTWNTLQAQDESLNKFKEKAKNIETGIQQLATLNVNLDEIEKGTFVTDAQLRMPQGDKAKMLTKGVIDDPDLEPLEIVKEFIHELGLVKGLTALWNLKKIKESGVDETLKQFSLLLGGMSIVANAMMEDKVIKVSPTPQKPASLDHLDKFDEAKAKQYLTEKELKAFEEKLASTPEKDRKAFIHELSKVLDLSEKMAGDIMKTSNAIQNINNYSAQIKASTINQPRPPVLLPDAMSTPRMTAEERSELTALLPSQIKPSKLFQILEIFSQDKPLDELIGELPRNLWTKENTPLILAVRNMRASMGREGIKQLYSSARTDPSNFVPQFQNQYKQWQIQNHENLIKELQQHALPTSEEGNKSQYSADLSIALENLINNNPFPPNDVVNTASLGAISEKISSSISTREQNIRNLSSSIAHQIKNAQFNDLPKELQQLRALKASDDELLKQALFLNSMNKLSKTPDLENNLTKYCIENAALKTLVAGQNNAKASFARLNEVAQKREELSKFLPKAKDRVAVLKKLDALEKEWKSESARLMDFLDRCQSTQDIDNLPDSLKPHLRTIAYLQHLHGIVLRKDQFENIDVALKNGATILTLLMGSGKTSTLMPFLLAIFLQMGHNVIGVLPRPQFGADMKQLDETTRNMMQYAGQEFIFNRDQLKIPVSQASLAILSQSCQSFLESCATHSKYILTTAESKASLDDKIGELETVLSMYVNNALRKEPPVDDKKKQELSALISRTEAALEMLYKMQEVFENPNTRVLTDEIDYILRSNYSVNAELGKKAAPPPLFTLPVHQLFTIIRDSTNPSITILNQLLTANEQISLNDKEKIDESLQAIASEWMQKYANHLPVNYRTPGTPENTLLLKWFSGGPFPANIFQNLNSASADALFVMRAALHQSLRTCLGLKIGLNTNFDPTSHALGVPATQGATNATTKYSDILMQLCVSQMIATYKPQGEEYITQAAPSTLSNLRKNKLQLERDLAESPEKKWLINEIELHQNAIEQFSSLIESKNEGKGDFSQELAGNEPWKLLIRQALSDELVSQNLVYATSSQIQRPVQAAFWGCNLIGFTGTATRNVSHLVTATGCNTAMDNVAKTGKSSTAEVIYRIASSLPKGLQTELETYPSDPKSQLDLFISKSKDNNERFLINQAGLCDHIPAEALVKILHQQSNRPIIHIDVTTQRKSAWIDGKLKELDKLSPQEKLQIEEKGLFYYHTQHTRGVHFDIPVGSEGSIFLSPTANANDRDQAFFRARKLGVGHIVKPIISEKENEEFKTQHTLSNNAQLIHLLGKNHEQTYQDEADEAKDAYMIRITAPLVKAGDRIRRRMRIDSKTIPALSETRGLTIDQVDERLAASKIQSDIIQAFQSVYINDTSTISYMNNLRSEGRKGVNVDTSEYLLSQISNRQMKLRNIQSELLSALFNNPPFEANKQLQKTVKDTLNELMENNLSVEEKMQRLSVSLNINNKPLSNFLEAFEEIFYAKEALDKEKNRIHTESEAITKELKPKTASAGQSNQTSETEAEAEEQQEQETQTSSQEIENQNRDNNNRDFFNQVDNEIFDFIEIDPSMDFRRIINNIFEPSRHGDKFSSIGKNLWTDRCVLSERLAKQLGENPLNLKNVAVIFAENDQGQLRIVLCDLLSEASYMLSPHNAYLFNQTIKFNQAERKLVTKPINFSVFRPLPNETGDLNLSYLGSALSMKGLKENIENEEEKEELIHYQAEAFIGLLHIGFTSMTEEQYQITAQYFQSQTPQMQTKIEESLKNHLSKTNPDLYHRAMQKLKTVAAPQN